MEPKVSGSKLRASRVPMRELTPVLAEWLGRPLAETRWMLEAARLVADPVAFGRGVPRGDGRPVVLMPGFLASDRQLLLLRRWLPVVGYRPHTAGFLFNVECSDRAVERVERLAEAINAATGRRVAITLAHGPTTARQRCCSRRCCRRRGSSSQRSSGQRRALLASDQRPGRPARGRSWRRR
jgi:hypothetical protein